MTIEIRKGRKGEMLWWECALCSNQALHKTRPDECHPKCAGHEWKLKKEQCTWKVGQPPWIHEEGEV